MLSISFPVVLLSHHCSQTKFPDRNSQPQPLTQKPNRLKLFCSFPVKVHPEKITKALMAAAEAAGASVRTGRVEGVRTEDSADGRRVTGASTLFRKHSLQQLGKFELKRWFAL